MKAIFSPGPAYSDPEVRKYAGWVRILDLYKEVLDEMGYKVFIPRVDPKLIDQSSTVAKISSYDYVASSQLPNDADIFLGPPGYSIAQMIKLGKNTKKFLYVWNNADWWRDEQLAEEYKRFEAHYDLSPTWRWINVTALKMCDHVIACSPWVKKTHAEVVPADKISIAFWGVDSDKFIPPAKESEGFRILFVGGDPIRKGLFYLIRALQDIKDYELWIVGCKPFAEVPQNWRQFGMVEHKDMLNIFQQCHILCIPTLEDGIALAIQEGMACGLVPITSPETAEVFKDNISGIQVGYRDVDAIRKAILFLKDRPDVRVWMSMEARMLAVKQTWVNTKEQMKEIIKANE